MRIVATKLHRAFPELDQFTDAECEMYVRRAANSPAYVACAAAAFLIVLAVGVAFAGVVFVAVVNGFETTSSRPLRGATNVILLLGFCWVVGLPCALAFMARDQVLREFLRRYVGHARCLGCDYSLLGQRLIGRDQFVCPECGRSTTLGELGLRSADDLLPRAAPAQSESSAGCDAGCVVRSTASGTNV